MKKLNDIIIHQMAKRKRLFMWLVMIAAAQVFVLIPIAIFLSLSADFLDILYYETDASPFSSV
jgi:hypothetical protein